VEGEGDDRAVAGLCGSPKWEFIWEGGSGRDCRFILFAEYIYVIYLRRSGI